MRQKSIFKQAPRIGVKTLLLVMLSTVLLFLDVRQVYTEKLRYYLNSAVAPLQYVVAYPALFIRDVKTSVTTQKALIKENQDLAAQLLMANMRSQKLLSLEKENNLLRTLLSSAQQINLKVKAAELMTVSLGGAAVNEVMLSEGQRDQVYLGQPVLDAYGVIGQVIGLSAVTSRVMLLTDRRSAIPVENNRTGFRAVLAGGGEGEKLLLMHVPKTEKIQVGDVLVTSGEGHLFPQGYPVGEVSFVDQSDENNFLTVEVTPSAHLRRSRFVLLVWPNAKNTQRIEMENKIKNMADAMQPASSSSAIQEIE